MADRPSNPSKAQLARSAAPSLVPGEEAARIVLSPLSFGEAPQIGVLGDTGAGKTTAMRVLVAMYLKSAPGHVLIVDDKELRPKFEGETRIGIVDLMHNPIQPETRVIIFRGIPSAGIDADPEEVAQLAWRRAGRGRKTLVVHDELVAGRGEYVKNAQWRKGIEYLPKSFTKGRAAGVGDIWAAQSPQMVPIDPFEQSNGILCFKLAGLGLARLKERDYLQGGAEEVIPRLHAMDVPPEQRGDFVLLRRGQPWDGQVYKFFVGGG